MSGRAILIVGGSGVVGSRIARELARDCSGRVVVAGRDLQRANATAAATGHGVYGRVLDVSSRSSIEAALDDVAVIVNCVDDLDRRLLHAAIERGIQYTDITPHLVDLGGRDEYEKIHGAAKASGARIVLGAGLVPGISSVMVRAVAQLLGGADTIQTALLLAAGDVSGPGSIAYLLRELSMSFQIHIEGASRSVRALSDPREVEFPPPIGRRRAYLFPFSDQVLYPMTMRSRTVRSLLSLEPPWLAGILRLLVLTGGARILARDSVCSAIAWLWRARAGHTSKAAFALRVDVAHEDRSGSATLVGRGQADATAVGAAAVARSLVDGEVAEPGAWMPEQVIDPSRFLTRLESSGLNVQITRQAENPRLRRSLEEGLSR